MSTLAQPVTAQVFSMGHSPTYVASRRERLRSKKETDAEKLRKKNRLNRRKTVVVKSSQQYRFTLHPKRWLLSDRDVPMDASIFFYMAEQTFQSIYENIMDCMLKQKAHFKKYKKYLDDKPSISSYINFLHIARKNQELHRAFGCLARRWIRSKLTLKNTEDLLTGEPPLQPVRIISWSTRSIYTFEANTIAKDIISRLLMSYYTFFPSPKLPRNPYTNEHLTEAEFYSLVSQLRKYGMTHWSIEALYSTNFDIKQFETDMYPKIKRHIHKSIFTNPYSDIAKEVLLEFIEDQHADNKKTYEEDIYTWAVNEKSRLPLIHRWWKQCSLFYKIRHFPKGEREDKKLLDSVYDATDTLCESPDRLIEKYDEVHDKKYEKLEDREISAALISSYHIVYTTAPIIYADALDPAALGPDAPGPAGPDPDDIFTWVLPNLPYESEED